MSKLLAVDPSLRATGWAIFSDGVLTHAGVLAEAGSALYAVRRIGSAVEVCSGVDELVCEFPRIYGHKGSKGADPNDLLWVAAVAGAVLSSTSAHTKCTVVAPSDWKGQAKKEKTERLVLETLRADELEVLRLCRQQYGHLTHNAVDAVGIGLYHLGRAGKNARKEKP